MIRGRVLKPAGPFLLAHPLCRSSAPNLAPVPFTRACVFKASCDRPGAPAEEPRGQGGQAAGQAGGCRRRRRGGERPAGHLEVLRPGGPRHQDVRARASRHASRPALRSFVRSKCGLALLPIHLVGSALAPESLALSHLAEESRQSYSDLPPLSLCNVRLGGGLRGGLLPAASRPGTRSSILFQEPGAGARHLARVYRLCRAAARLR